MLTLNGSINLTWLPGYEDMKATAEYHAWGTPRIGDKVVGEHDFVEDGPELSVTELRISLFGAMVRIDTHGMDAETREKMNTFVLDAVGEHVLTDRLWETLNP